MSDEQLKAALNLMRRMPPSSTETSLSGLINLVPDLTDELLQRIDQPLKIAKDTVAGRNYVICDYNRDGDSYRYLHDGIMLMQSPDYIAGHPGPTNTFPSWTMDLRHLTSLESSKSNAMPSSTSTGTCNHTVTTDIGISSNR